MRRGASVEHVVSTTRLVTHALFGIFVYTNVYLVFKFYVYVFPTVPQSPQNFSQSVQICPGMGKYSQAVILYYGKT